MNKFENPCKDNNLIYDVGMHKGEDTDYYLKKGFRVIGFEAIPDLIAFCKARFSKEIESGRLTIIEGAITDSSSKKNKMKTVKFFMNRNVSVWGTVLSEWANRNESLGTSNDIIEVPVVDFSACLSKFGIPHFIKIDIEGMDTACLSALKDYDQKPDYISIESEKVDFKKLKEEFYLFKKLGYSEFQAVNQEIVTRQKEPVDSKEGHFIGYKFQAGASGLFGDDLPNKWKNDKQILKKYEKIFFGYKLFGDYGNFKDNLMCKILLKIINKFIQNPIPGWYDTHARHSSIRNTNN